MIIDRSQRWRDRRARFVPGSSVINPAEFSVDIIEKHGPVADFIAQHHYAATTPPVRLAIGLFRNGQGGTSELAGVAVFSTPVNNSSVKLRTGLDDITSVCDLGRLVLLDDVGANGETFLIARALKLLRREKNIASVISYADPIKRRDAAGNLTLGGHLGVLYQVRSAHHSGQTAARWNLLMPSGRVLSARTLAKLKARDQGFEGALRLIVNNGADPREPGEEIETWLARLQAVGHLRRTRHPGCYAYTFPLTRAARLALRKVPSVPYPRLDHERTHDDVTALPLFASIV